MESGSGYTALGTWVHYMPQIPRVAANMHFSNVPTEDGLSEVGWSLTPFWVTCNVSGTP